MAYEVSNFNILKKEKNRTGRSRGSKRLDLDHENISLNHYGVFVAVVSLTEMQQLTKKSI